MTAAHPVDTGPLVVVRDLALEQQGSELRCQSRWFKSFKPRLKSSQGYGSADDTSFFP